MTQQLWWRIIRIDRAENKQQTLLRRAVKGFVTSPNKPAGDVSFKALGFRIPRRIKGRLVTFVAELVDLNQVNKDLKC